MKSFYAAVTFALIAVACGGQVDQDPEVNGDVPSDNSFEPKGTGGSVSELISESDEGSTPIVSREEASHSMDEPASSVSDASQRVSDPRAIVVSCACMEGSGVQALMSSGDAFGPCDCQAGSNDGAVNTDAGDRVTVASSAIVEFNEQASDFLLSHCPRDINRESMGFTVTPRGGVVTLTGITIHHDGTGPVEDVLDMSIAYVRYDGTFWRVSVSDPVTVDSNVIRVPFQNGARIEASEEGYFFVRVSLNATPGDTHSFSVEDIEFEGETVLRGELPINGSELSVLERDRCPIGM